LVESLADMEALSLRCRSEQSREYVAEAVLCYRTGAYRASIVSTWIAIVFDLIDKIRGLALSGDAKAKALEQRYETYLQQIEHGDPQGIKNALQFERDILTICKQELQLFDQQQFVDLSRLREDRHRCAHPSFQEVGEPYRPSAEQARLHLRNAVTHVLAQPPVQGRAALAELRTLVSSNYFPVDAPKAVTQLSNSAFEKASDALVRGFVDELVFGFFDQNSPYYHKPQVFGAINAAMEMYRPLVEQRLSKQLGKVVRDQSDVEMLFAAVLIARVDSSWSFLDLPARDKILQLVRKGKAADVVKVAWGLARIDALKADVNARIATFELEELAEGIQSYSLGEKAKERAIELLSESKNWIRTNEVINRAVLPLFDSLNRADFERIIRLPTDAGADLPGATAYGTLIERLKLTNLFTPDELKVLLTTNGATYLVSEVFG
jgi:hypothetical protein